MKLPTIITLWVITQAPFASLCGQSPLAVALGSGTQKDGTGQQARKAIAPIVPAAITPAPNLAGMRKDLLGQFPLALPRSGGVDDLIVLSSEWIVAVTSEAQELSAKINELSGGDFYAMIKDWEASDETDNPDYTLWHGWQEIRDKHIIEARKSIGEADYKNADFYTIRSDTDAAYQSPAQPLQVARHYVPLDKTHVKGGGDFHYAHYSYLRLPKPLENGNTYRVKLGNGKYTDFLYDESHTISRAIKVNQVGYLPDAKDKFAYVGAYLFDAGPMEVKAKTFEVVNVATGKVELAGNLKLRDQNSRFTINKESKRPKDEVPPLMHGEIVYELDITKLTAEGHYFIRIPGMGRSWPFTHAADVYGEAFYTATRGMFHQRAAMEYKKPFTNWKRGNYHGERVYESDWVPFGPGFNAPEGLDDDLRFDSIAATIDRTRFTENVDGGWYDAADWDRNLMHYACIFDLLYSYEIAPKKFTDGQLNIPESGNGIPDIIDEAAYGLKVWTHSMQEDGGVSGYIETTTHPMIDGPYDYAFSLRTRWTSLLYAGAAAQLAELIAPFDAKQSEEYLALAKRAYEFGNNPENSLGNHTLHALNERGAGTPYTVSWQEEDDALAPFMIHAKTRLYLASGEKAYLTELDDLLKVEFTMPGEWPFSLTDYSAWLLFPIALHGDKLPIKSPPHFYRRFYIKKAEEFVAQITEMPYRHTWENYKHFWMGWGSSDMTNKNRFLLMAFALTDFPPFRDTAILNNDYMFGANPMGMSWTTGIGQQYPAVLQHEVSEHDQIADPVPGITLYGITGSPIHYLFRNSVWSSPVEYNSETLHSFYEPKEIPLYRRYTAHAMVNPGQCEFTIEETISSTALACALLIPEGWKPSEELKSRKPRDPRVLFGFHYLP